MPDCENGLPSTMTTFFEKLSSLRGTCATIITCQRGPLVRCHGTRRRSDTPSKSERTSPALRPSPGTRPFRAARQERGRGWTPLAGREIQSSHGDGLEAGTQKRAGGSITREFHFHISRPVSPLRSLSALTRSALFTTERASSFMRLQMNWAGRSGSQRIIRRIIFPGANAIAC